MSQTILEIIEESLLNIATRYKEFSSNPDVLESDLKGFDEQLNDIMDRYNKLKGLQSTYTAEELTIKLNEFENLYDDMVLKINNGFFNGQNGKDGTNGADGKNGLQGIQGEKGIDGILAFEALTPQQLLLLKGDKGDTGLQGLKGDTGLAGQSLTYASLTTQQKQDLATFFTNTSNIKTFGVFYLSACTKGNLFIKTNIKVTNSLFINLNVMSNAEVSTVNGTYYNDFLLKNLALVRDSAISSYVQRVTKILGAGYEVYISVSTDGFLVFRIVTALAVPIIFKYDFCLNFNLSNSIQILEIIDTVSSVTPFGSLPLTSVPFVV